MKYPIKKDHFKYPFSREPIFRNMIYSLIISISYFLVIGIPLYFGYIVRIIRGRSNNEYQNTPPKYRPLRELIYDGLVIICYGILFLGLPGGLIYLISEVLIFDIVQSIQSISRIEASIINGALGGLVLLLVIGSFILPASIFLYIINGSFIDGFRSRKISNIVISRKYLLFYMKFLVISIVGTYVTNIVFQSIILIPIAGLLWYIYGVNIGLLFGDYLKKYKNKKL